MGINDPLWVRGYVWSDGYYSNSDSRYKNNIQNIGGSLSKVKQMQGVTYEYNNIGEKVIPEEADSKGYTNPVKQVGFIAQDIEKLFPEIVHTDGNGYKSIDYSKITVILVEAVKEQQKMIDELRAEIEKLKKK